MAVRKSIVKHEATIDPLALLLPHDIYVSINLPRPSEIDLEKIKSRMAKLSSAEKTAVRKNARAMVAYAKAVSEAVGE